MRRSAVSEPIVDSLVADIAASGLCIDEVAHTGFVAGQILELASLGLWFVGTVTRSGRLTHFLQVAHHVALSAGLPFLRTAGFDVTFLPATITRDVPATFAASDASISFVLFAISTTAASASSIASVIPAIAFAV